MSTKSTLTRIAEIATIIAAIAACIALIPAFGLWRTQVPPPTGLDDNVPNPTRTTQATVPFTATLVDTAEPTLNLPPIVPTPRAGEARVIGGAPMMFVPAGDFLMGSSDSDPQAQIDEKPQHTVYLDAFWIDKLEVTNAQYKKCVDAGKCSAPISNKSFTRDSYFGSAQFDNYPVIYVSWDDAKTYCEWAGKRLPTEAEWEKAARGTQARIYPWGDEWDAARLNSSEGGKRDTTEVGSYPSGASPYGVMDMAGNVWEWVADWYDGSYYQNSPQSNPQGPSSEQYRALRGGAWLTSVETSRVRRTATTTTRRSVTAISVFGAPSSSPLFLNFCLLNSDF